MEITCFHCRHVWRVSKGQFFAAKIKFLFGDHEHTFICPNCQAENVISKQEFKTSDPQIPVTGGDAQTESPRRRPPRADNDGASAPTNPVTAPDGTARHIRAIVLERDVSLRRVHEPAAEVMGSLRKGEEVNIVDTWTERDEVWVQIGPERWTPVEHDGGALLELIED